MKNKNFLLSLIFFLLFSHFSLFSQDLSNSIYRQLRKYNFKPSTQNLINNGVNEFPYNIIINVPSPNKTSQNLILVFFQEQYDSHKELIREIINYTKEGAFEYNTTILFAYGNHQLISKNDMILGTDAFLNNINTNEEHTAFVIDFDNEKNTVIANCKGYTAPAWLVKNEFNVFSQSNIPTKLPVFYLSQMYDFNFYSEKTLQGFFENDIPAIKLCFTKDVEQSAILDIIKESLTKYDKDSHNSWDRHFLMLKYFNSYIMLSENTTIKTIIFIVFGWLTYIVLLIFINVRQKHLSWLRVKYIWYAIPVTFILTYLSFLLGRFIYDLVALKQGDIQQIYTLLGFQIFLSFLIVSTFYLMILLFNHNFTPTSVDFLITLCCFINQSVFILVDISLFPIFMFICILSIFSLIIKNNILHIIFFVLMIIAFIPYANVMITTSDTGDLKNFIFTNPFVSLALSTILYPIYILDLRVLTSFRVRAKKITSVVLMVGLSTLIILAVIVTVGFVRIKQLTPTIKDEHITIYNTEENLITLNSKDSPVFDDIIRTLNISIKEQPLQCEVILKAQNSSPVLYTDYDYESLSQTSVSFTIPYCPPEQMTFSYGASKEPCNIIVIATFPTEKENTFKRSVMIQKMGVEE